MSTFNKHRQLAAPVVRRALGSSRQIYKRLKQYDVRTVDASGSPAHGCRKTVNLIECRKTGTCLSDASHRGRKTVV